jgi:hypothetical protein
MFRAEANHRSNTDNKFDGLKLMVLLSVAILPWVLIFAFGHRLLGV